MFLINKNISKILPIIRLEFYINEISIIISTNIIREFLIIIKNHFNYQFNILIFISGIDYPENCYRFQIAYEFLSLKFNARMWIKVFTNELFPVPSINQIYKSACWWESEIWDMFGIYFIYHYNLTRLLTDYGFQGYPLRKNFPLNGFTEIKYDIIKKWIICEKIEFSQEFRIFQFVSPWKNSKIKNEKINWKR